MGTKPAPATKSKLAHGRLHDSGAVRTRRQRRLLAIGGAIAVAVTLGLLALPGARLYTNSVAPWQFHQPLSTLANPASRTVLAVAHNAGNDAETTAAALAHGADVIEIDVISVDGTLAVGRPRGWDWLADAVFRGETLIDAWNYSRAAEITQLDLQETGRGLLDAMVVFLGTTARDRRVMVSTRDAHAIEYLRPRIAPSVSLLFSVPFPDAVNRLETDAALADAISGITVFEGLITTDLVTWAHARGLEVFAWTVNSGTRLSQLVRLGVDGITTDNLAIIEALSD